MSVYHRWVPSATSDGEADSDQEAELGDGWHAVVGPYGDHGHWSWELWDTWLHDDESHIIASGFAPFEPHAKCAAIDAYNLLTASHGADRVEPMTTTDTIKAPAYILFPDDSAALCVSIRGDNARVMNEDGIWWDEPLANLRPAPEGWTW